MICRPLRLRAATTSFSVVRAVKKMSKDTPDVFFRVTLKHMLLCVTWFCLFAGVARSTGLPILFGFAIIPVTIVIVATAVQVFEIVFDSLARRISKIVIVRPAKSWRFSTKNIRQRDTEAE